MYKWRVVVYLESGATVAGKYCGEETTSDDVAEKLFGGKPSDFVGIAGLSRLHQIFIKKGSVAAFDISLWVEKGE